MNLSSSPTCFNSSSSSYIQTMAASSKNSHQLFSSHPRERGHNINDNAETFLSNIEASSDVFNLRKGKQRVSTNAAIFYSFPQVLTKILLAHSHSLFSSLFLSFLSLFYLSFSLSLFPLLFFEQSWSVRLWIRSQIFLLFISKIFSFILPKRQTISPIQLRYQHRIPTHQ